MSVHHFTDTLSVLHNVFDFISGFSVSNVHYQQLFDNDGTSMPHNNNVRTEYLAVLALYTLYFIHGAHARNYATKAT